MSGEEKRNERIPKTATQEAVPLNERPEEEGSEGETLDDRLSQTEDCTFDSRAKLKKNISILHGIALVVGTIIGTGIFITPNSITRRVNAPATSIMVWFAGGCVAATGGLVYAELGAMIPLSGADVAYLRKIYGPLPAFLSFWLTRFLLGAMGNAPVVMGFSRYFWSLFYDNPLNEVTWWMDKALVIAVFFIIVAIVICRPTLILNCIVFFTAAKVVALIIIIVVGIVYMAKGHTENLSSGFQGTNTDIEKWGDAWNAVIYSYGGWNQICMMTSEVKNPQKNIPIIVISSIGIVTILYLLTIVSFHAVVPLNVMVQGTAIASEFGLRTLGEAGKVILALGVVFSTLGCAQCSFLTEARVIHAGAAEGLTPSCFTLVSKRFKTPIVAIIYFAAMETIFLLVGGIDGLINSSSFTQFPFAVLCSVGLIIMRITHPEVERPYKAPLICPILFIIFGLFVFILPFLGQYWLISIIWVVLVLLGIPVYYLLVQNVCKWKILKKWDGKVKDVLAKFFRSD